MTTKIVNIRTCDDPRDAIHRAIELLAAGHWVAMPTDSSYVVAAQAIHSRSVQRLRAESGHPLALAVRSLDELLDFSPELGDEQQRLCRRLWPGPVIMEIPISGPNVGLLAALPDEVRQAIAWERGFRARFSGNAISRSLQRLTASPLVFAERWGDALLESTEDIRRIGADVRLVLDAGTIENSGSCTVIRLDAEGWNVTQTGVLDEAAIQDRLPFAIVFVCTGNTCRSPLAAAILRKMLAERLECDIDQLSDHGYYVASAGISADYGMPAAAPSLALAQEHGLDLVGHQSQFLTDMLLDRADRVYAMTDSHRAAILARRPDLEDRVELLSREGIDIVDPIGGGALEYEHCRAEIERELLVILEQLPIDRS